MTDARSANGTGKAPGMVRGACAHFAAELGVDTQTERVPDLLLALARELPSRQGKKGLPGTRQGEGQLLRGRGKNT